MGTRLNTADIGLDEFIPTLKVLNVGCGNSLMSEEMYDLDGYREIYNIDISTLCLDRMRARN